MTQSPLPAALVPTSLIDGVEAAACDALGIKRLRHRSALRSLRLNSGVNLAELVHRIVSSNWTTGRAADNKNRSRQNWRWALQPQIGERNRSTEVVLERAIAGACVRRGRIDWANQIPVASGLISGAADGRRALDLAYRSGERRFQLIELKIASDTPLYAAVELLGYASAWLLARADLPERSSVLLEAEHVDLRVLAPAPYYAPFDLLPLEASLRHGVRLLGERCGVTLSFGFDVLPAELSRPPLPQDATLLELLSQRRPLHDGTRHE